MIDPPKNPTKEFVEPEDPTMAAEALRGVVKELTAKIQFLVDWIDQRGLLEDHAFTFPDGDYWKSRDLEKVPKDGQEMPRLREDRE